MARAVAPYDILCVGDSLTAGLVQGTLNTGGYRRRLFQRLISDPTSPLLGRPIRSIGLRTNNNNGDGVWFPNHAGVGGERIDQIQSRIAAEIATGSPKVVILHAGMNDAVQSYLVGTAADRLATLWQTLLDIPGVQKVYVANIQNCKSTATTTFNNLATIRAAIPTACAAQIANPKSVYMTGFSTLVPDPGGFFPGDDIHPDQTNYNGTGDLIFGHFVSSPPTS